MEPVQDIVFNPIIVRMAVFGSWLISAFPVCYGYGDSSLASRGDETLGIYISIGLYIFAINTKGGNSSCRSFHFLPKL